MAALRRPGPILVPRAPGIQPRHATLGMPLASPRARLLIVRAEKTGDNGGGWFKLPSFLGGKKAAPAETTSGTAAESAELLVSVHATPEVPPPETVDAVVVGAGLAGLAAARALQKAGIEFVILEASDGVGGRARTDQFEGFLLDRGFQIFLSAYPEAKAALDYEALDLKPFYAGALVRLEDNTFHRVADPFRHPVDGLASLPNPIGSIADKLRVGLLRLRAVAKSEQDIWSAPETTIESALLEQGFSHTMIDRFFRPFLGGIFFDRELTTTSRMLEFVMKMLALGANTLPAAGIGAVASQLASALPPSALCLNSPVASVTAPQAPGGPAEVTLASGRVYRATRGVVVAVEQPEAEKLLGEVLLGQAPSAAGEPRSTVCLYFAANEAPSPEPVLYLNGAIDGIINNLCFPSTVAPGYAPPGKALVSVSLLGSFEGKSNEELEVQVRRELKQWFPGAGVDTWRHLRTYRIPFAQPDQRPPTDLQRPQQLGQSVFVCGDHRRSATFDGALASGREAGEALATSIRSETKQLQLETAAA